MNSIFIIMFTAILAENFIFSSFYGCCPFLGVSKKPSAAFSMGMAVTFVMTLSSAAAWAVYHYLLVPFKLEYLKTIAFMLLIAVIGQFIDIFLRKFIPALYGAIGIHLPMITTNCAVLGAALVSVERDYSFVESVVFGFSAALGFTLAVMVFAGVRARLEFVNPPKAFRGFPILLISAGLAAMAFSGFFGMRIF